jgi:hypothetical protein
MAVKWLMRTLCGEAQSVHEHFIAIEREDTIE